MGLINWDRTIHLVFITKKLFPLQICIAWGCENEAEHFVSVVGRASGVCVVVNSGCSPNESHFCGANVAHIALQ